MRNSLGCPPLFRGFLAPWDRSVQPCTAQPKEMNNMRVINLPTVAGRGAEMRRRRSTQAVRLCVARATAADAATERAAAKKALLDLCAGVAPFGTKANLDKNRATTFHARPRCARQRGRDPSSPPQPLPPHTSSTPRPRQPMMTRRQSTQRSSYLRPPTPRKSPAPILPPAPSLTAHTTLSSPPTPARAAAGLAPSLPPR